VYSHLCQALSTDSLASYVHQWDAEFGEVKKARRPGRPASTREDLLRMRIAALEKEEQDGFCEKLPASHFTFINRS
jgi:hypothetical protein